MVLVVTNHRAEVVVDQSEDEYHCAVGASYQNFEENQIRLVVAVVLDNPLIGVCEGDEGCYNETHSDNYQWNFCLISSRRGDGSSEKPSL